jgi:hypothetical protein
MEKDMEDIDRIARKRAGAKLGGWAIGLAFHGLAVFFLGSSSRLRERMIARERRRLEMETRADRR